MKILPNGSIQYEDEYELNYELLMALGFSVDDNGYVYDSENKDTITQIEMDGNKIKATIDANHIVYAGQEEILFEPLRNVQMIGFLFGYFIKNKIEQGYQLYSYYQEEQLRPAEVPTEEYDTDKYTCITVQHSPGSTTSSDYFRNRCLKFIHMIFIIEGDQVDLSNFDTLENMV